MTDEINTTSEIEVRIKMRDQASGEMIDAVIATAKLTKADAGKNPGDKAEETIYISINPGSLPNYADAVISVNGASKLTKADAE
jgi:hypothetical protein